MIAATLAHDHVEAERSLKSCGTLRRDRLQWKSPSATVLLGTTRSPFEVDSEVRQLERTVSSNTKATIEIASFTLFPW